MIELSLSVINENSPYLVTEGGNSCSFRFFTASGVHYSVDFMYDDLITEDESFQLVIANLNNKKS